MMRALIGTSLLAASLLVGGAVPASAQAKPTLGPYGYGSVKLGMSLKKARTTGAIVPIGSVTNPCTHWHFKKFPKVKWDWHLVISDEKGVVAISGRKGMKTPEGIGIGASFRRLKAAYPRLSKLAPNVYAVTTPRNRKAEYRFEVYNGKVGAIFLALKNRDCVR